MKPIRYIIALILTVSICAALYLSSNQKVAECESILPKLELACRTLQGQSDILSQENANLSAQLTDLSAQLDIMQQQLDRKQDKTDRGGERGTKRIMEVTAYDLSYKSCGKLPNHPEYGITASGERVKEWYTVAAGPELPFGTQIFIPYFAEMPNNGVFTVQDRGGSIKDGCIDVFIADNTACMEFGRRELEVWILE